MALIKCPECRRDVSDSASACPHCGYKIEKEKIANFVPIKTPLSNSKPQKSEIIKSVLLLFFGIPTFISGFFFFTEFYGIILMMLGASLAGAGVIALFAYQDGECPYCGGKMRLNRGDPLNHGVYSVRCAFCNNVMRKTKTHLITTHPTDTNEE